MELRLAHFIEQLRGLLPANSLSSSFHGCKMGVSILQLSGLKYGLNEMMYIRHRLRGITQCVRVCVRIAMGGMSKGCAWSPTV